MVPELSRYEAFRHSRDGQWESRGFDVRGPGRKIVESKWRWSCFVFLFISFFWEGEGGSCFLLVIFPAIFGEAMKACYNKDDEGLKVFGKRNGSNIALSLNCLKLH